MKTVRQVIEESEEKIDEASNRYDGSISADQMNKIHEEVLGVTFKEAVNNASLMADLADTALDSEEKPFRRTGALRLMEGIFSAASKGNTDPAVISMVHKVGATLSTSDKPSLYNVAKRLHKQAVALGGT